VLQLRSSLVYRAVPPSALGSPSECGYSVHVVAGDARKIARRAVRCDHSFPRIWSRGVGPTLLGMVKQLCSDHRWLGCLGGATCCQVRTLAGCSEPVLCSLPVNRGVDPSAGHNAVLQRAAWKGHIQIDLCCALCQPSVVRVRGHISTAADCHLQYLPPPRCGSKRSTQG